MRLRSFVVNINDYAHRHSFTFPLILLFETLLTYGIMGFSCGFYWDDWPPVLLSNIHQPNIFWSTYGDRPFSSWTYTVMFPLLQNSAPAWQLAAMLFRWVGILFFFYLFIELFSEQKSLFRWASLIAIVIPTFQYQLISVAFSQHFLTFAIFATSLYFLMLSIKHPRYFWVLFPLSILFEASHIFMMEYFVGLEILRPIILFLSLKKFSNQKRPVSKALLLYLPFFFVLLVYLYWRLIYCPMNGTPSNQAFLLTNLISNPVSTVKDLFAMIITDLRFIFITSGIDRLWPIDFTLSSKSPWFYTSVGVVGAVIAFLFFGEKENNPSKVSLKTFWVNIGFGLMIFIFGVAPAWFLLRQIAIGKYSERFALAALPGIAIILAFIIGRLATSSKSRNLIFSLLLLASISYQVQVGNLARKDFIEQKKIYSQLKWRIPVLLPGTAIYSPGIFSGLEAYYSYSMGINLLYDDNMSEAMKYWFFTPRFYEISDLLNDPNSSLKDAMRTTFEGQAGKMIAVYKNGSGCLLVLDPVYSALEVSPPVSSFELYGSLTNFDLIVDDQTKETVFPQAFGKISQNDWCYYFEKADLAKQEKNWDQVISLYSEATQKGLTPIKSAEFIPLITALIEKGQIDQAVSVTQEAITFSKAVTPAVCKLWQSSAIKNPIISKDQIDAAFGVGTCNP